EPEVVALAEGPDGSCYAAALASEASLVDLAAARAKASGGDAAKEDGAEAKGEGEATVTISSESTPAFVGSRPAGFKGAHSSVLRISPAGVVEKLWEFDAETVYSLRWHGNRLWVGTGLDGKLYSLRDRKMVLEKDVDERQIVALADGPTGPVFATTNASAVFSVSAESEPRGVYTSAALDAVQVARFGTLRWLGDLPAGAKVRFSARSGMSGEPDRTWSSWTPQADGREVSLGAVPVGRFLQWRAELESANGREPTLTDVTVSYVQENLAPRVERFTVREPGEIIVPANFNPGTQVFEPTSPTRGGIFTTLVPAERKDEGRRKTLWKKGYRTLTWDAEDPNDDDLVYSLRFRRESPPSEWLQMAEDLEDTHYSFDAAALADGTYRFLLQAVDRPDDGADEGLMAEEISEPVIIDNSVPELNGVERTDRGLEIELTDAWSPLRSVRVSVDAGDWRQLTAADGLLDGRREKLIIALPESADLLLVQAMDASFNLVTFDLSKELP
ncbi:MAG: hypothetical protein OEM62_13335, partial [Acidobacteriota bacterium]|nr:hypothetical protein [Acidobacteriota bacterium]